VVRSQRQTEKGSAVSEADPYLAGRRRHVRQTKNRYNPPDRPFAHSDDCKIVKADPNVEIPWSRLEYGFWKRECVCSYETWQEPAPNRVRLDPYDPKTASHLGQCEYVSENNPDVMKVLLRITEKDGYWWVECAGCESGWQVPFYAHERVG
jgi:hypothetical protein